MILVPITKKTLVEAVPGHGGADQNAQRHETGDKGIFEAGHAGIVSRGRQRGAPGGSPLLARRRVPMAGLRARSYAHP